MHSEAAWQQLQPSGGHVPHAHEGALWYGSASIQFEKICERFHPVQQLQSRRTPGCPQYASGASRKHAKSLDQTTNPIWFCWRVCLHCRPLEEDLQIQVLHTTKYQELDETNSSYVPVEGLQSRVQQDASSTMHFYENVESFPFRMWAHVDICAWFSTIEAQIQAWTYLQLRSWTADPPAANRILIKWVNIAFQTPSSNSCSKSTTNSVKKLNRNWKKRSEKAFWG